MADQILRHATTETCFRDLVPDLCHVARSRLAQILNSMKRNPTYAALMTCLPADLVKWIVSNVQIDFGPTTGSSSSQRVLDHGMMMPSLSATSNLIQRCLHYCTESQSKEELEVYHKVMEMSIVAKKLIEIVHWAEQHYKTK